MLFVLKKVIAQFTQPLPAATLLMLIGLGLLWFTRRQKIGKILASLGLLALLLASNNVLPYRLLAPLEAEYPVFDTSQPLPEDPAYIVVLGSGHMPDPALTAASRLSERALVRVVEGVRLHRAYPQSTLIVAGGVLATSAPEAESMALAAEELGVPAAKIIRESQSLDTDDQARLIHKIVGDQPFILVTSAAHMSRAMALFRKQGMSPYPAPTGQLVKGGAEGIDPNAFFPNGQGVIVTEIALHEYVGRLWAKISGRS